MSEAFKPEMVREWPKGFTGCKGGQFIDGNTLASDAWGPECKSDDLSGLVLFAYLFRRFGPPAFPGDEYKDLACYVLTTPDPDVHLWLSPSGSPASYAVGGLWSKALEEEHRRPAQEYSERMEAWWIDHHPEVLNADKTDFIDKDAASAAYGDFLYGSKQDKAPMYADLGEPPWLTEPSPHSTPWRELTGIALRVNTALHASLTALRTPVYVRDVPISIVVDPDESDDGSDESEDAGVPA